MSNEELILSWFEGFYKQIMVIYMTKIFGSSELANSELYVNLGVTQDLSAWAHDRYSMLCTLGYSYSRDLSRSQVIESLP